MMELPDLSCDNMSVDTSDAITYFERNKYEFKCNEDEDIHRNKIIISHKGLRYTLYTENEKLELTKPIEDLTQKLRILAKEVESNARLFSQLEYLTRNYPVEQVLNCDIKLIVQNLLYWSDKAEEENRHTWKVNVVYVGSDNTALASLGLVAQMLKINGEANIVSNKNTVVTCHLFKELCHKVGLREVRLFFSDTMKPRYTSYYPGNCVGVITENADIDSAVDVLLESSTMCPWKLARVLVQENVYNTFKRALQWKTSLQPPSTVTIANDHKSKCTEVCVYKGKVLCVDYAGRRADEIIAVEAYRTTKELLSLLADSPHSFMSLWSNSLGESNEIAYSKWSPNTIWINDFGDFDGPNKSSQPFYEPFIDHYKSKIDVNNSAIEIRKQWSRLTFEQRRNLIVTTLNNIGDVTIGLVAASIQNWSRDDVFYVDNGKMCVCITKPHEFLHFPDLEETETVNIFRPLLIGAAVVIGYKERSCLKAFTSSLIHMNELVNALRHVGVPVQFKVVGDVSVDAVEILDFEMVTNGYTKVIWTNFGTIFAN